MDSSLVSLVLLFATITGTAQSIRQTYVIGFMRTENVRENGLETLYVTSKHRGTVKVEIPSTNNVSYFSTIPLGTYTLRIPASQSLTGAASGKRYKGIRLTSTEEISVFGVSSGKGFSEGFAALSLRERAAKYVVVSFKPASKLHYSRLLVVSNVTKSRIIVHLRTTETVTYLGRVYKNGDSIVETLNDLDILQLSSHGDLSGTAVYSDKPISVFSGNDCAFVTPTVREKSDGPCGNLIEQIPPVDEWGREFVTTPYGNEAVGKTLRIVAGFHGTSVTSNCMSGYIKSREYLEFVSAKTCDIFCSESCFVVQYGQASITTSLKDKQYTKPFMTIVPPTSKYANNYLLPTPFVNDRNVRAFVSIIIQTEKISGLLIDEHDLLPQRLMWIKIPNSNFSVAYTPARSPEKLIHIRHLLPEVKFCTTLYGLGVQTSFGFPGGWTGGMSTRCLKTQNSGSGLDVNCIPHAGDNGVGFHIQKGTVELILGMAVNQWNQTRFQESVASSFSEHCTSDVCRLYQGFKPQDVIINTVPEELTVDLLRVRFAIRLPTIDGADGIVPKEYLLRMIHATAITIENKLGGRPVLYIDGQKLVDKTAATRKDSADHKCVAMIGSIGSVVAVVVIITNIMAIVLCRRKRDKHPCIAQEISGDEANESQTDSSNISSSQESYGATQQRETVIYSSLHRNVPKTEYATLQQALNGISTEEKPPYEDMETYSIPHRKVNMLQSNDRSKSLGLRPHARQDLQNPSINGQTKTSSFNSEFMRQRASSAPVVKPKPRVSAVAGNRPVRSAQQQERDSQTRCNSFSVAPQFRRAGLLGNTHGHDYVNSSSDHQVKVRQSVVMDKERRRTRNASIESEYIYPTCDSNI